MVREVGPSVRSFAPGDRVVLPFGICCGECWYCRSGATSLCARWRYLGFGDYGGGLAGTQAEAVRVPLADANLLRIPDDVDDERALFAGDVATTGHYGARLVEPETGRGGGRRRRPGRSGSSRHRRCGRWACGRCCCSTARSPGSRWRRHAGAIPVRVGDDVDVSKAVKEHTEGRGADAAIDAVGLVPAYQTTLRATRRGGRVCVLGVYGPDERIEVQMGAYWVRQLRLVFAGVCPVQSSWQATMDLLRSGELDPGPLVSHRLPLEEARHGVRPVRPPRGDEGAAAAVATPCRRPRASAPATAPSTSPSSPSG